VTRVVHCQRAPFDVYIGHANGRAGLNASKWANPFKLPRGADLHTRLAVLAKYAAWLEGQPELLAAIGELRGKVLGCWCAPPLPCHGHILAKLADGSAA
jgi:hypothetical protein